MIMGTLNNWDLSLSLVILVSLESVAKKTTLGGSIFPECMFAFLDWIVHAISKKVEAIWTFADEMLSLSKLCNKPRKKKIRDQHY